MIIQGWVLVFVFLVFLFVCYSDSFINLSIHLQTNPIKREPSRI